MLSVPGELDKRKTLENPRRQEETEASGNLLQNGMSRDDIEWDMTGRMWQGLRSFWFS